MLMVMQPQQPDYNFIVNAGQKPKKALLPAGNSKQTRILVVLGGVVLLLIIGFVIMTVLSSAGKGQQETLLKASQQQAELIRVSKIGIEKARDANTRNFAITTNITLQSDQAGLLAISKAKPKEIALGKSTKTDLALTTAEQSNKFDEVFTQTVQTQLIAYQKTLKSVYDATDGKKSKATLTEQFNHLNVLLAKR